MVQLHTKATHCKATKPNRLERQAAAADSDAFLFSAVFGAGVFNITAEAYHFTESFQTPFSGARDKNTQRS